METKKMTEHKITYVTVPLAPKMYPRVPDGSVLKGEIINDATLQLTIVSKINAPVVYICIEVKEAGESTSLAKLIGEVAPGKYAFFSPIPPMDVAINNLEAAVQAHPGRIPVRLTTLVTELLTSDISKSEGLTAAYTADLRNAYMEAANNRGPSEELAFEIATQAAELYLDKWINDYREDSDN